MRPCWRCWAEVDGTALRENVFRIRELLGREIRILAVVKAEAYGHGLKEVARLLMEEGVGAFGVAKPAEADRIRALDRNQPILMLGAALPEEVEPMVEEGIMPTLSTVEEAEAFASAARRARKELRVHVKVDTGMGRLGAQPADVIPLLERINQLPGLVLDGIYTHFAAAEDDAAFSQAQRRELNAVIDRLGRLGWRRPLVHAHNSAGLLHEPLEGFPMIRPGLLLYGVVPRGMRKDRSAWLERHVRPAMTWKCRVTLVKPIEKGKPLSYGHTFIAPHRMRVATISAGYGDGYLRAISPGGEVLIRGQRCPILGRITMDQMMVDVSGMGDLESGEEVVLMGRQGDEAISANELAEWAGTVPWEILTNITHRVPRMHSLSVAELVGPVAAAGRDAGPTGMKADSD